MMKQQTQFQTHEDSARLPMRGLRRHAAVRTIPEREVPSNTPLEPRFGYDFSRMPVNPDLLKPIQTKLAIRRPGDGYEQEADWMADHVLATWAHHPVSATPPRIQRFAGRPTRHAEAAPASVDQALASPGRSLEPALRQDMEQRFSYDFSRVRVHSGVVAERSARDVGAHAYTVGHDIVFGTGRFALGTDEGIRLLAHELTHVVQQSQGAHQLQRWAYCTPARLSLHDCPPRKPGEAQIARDGPMVFLSLKVLTTGEEGVLVANFDIGSATIKPSLDETIYWKQFLKNVAANRSRWKLLGFADCHGEENLNQKLREDRAAAIFNILPTQVKSQVVSHEGAPMHDCITENSNPAERTLNRSVALMLAERFADIKGEIIEGKIFIEESDTEDCDKSQRDALARAFPLAKKMVRAALGAMNDEILMKKYFGKDALAHRNHIRRNFVEISDGLNWGPTFQCEEADSWWCDGAYARVIPVVGLNIHICPSAIAKGDDFLARTLVHECAHGFAFIFNPDEICAGGSPPSMDTTDAEDNADCYGEFAGDALARSP